MRRSLAFLFALLLVGQFSIVSASSLSEGLDDFAYSAEPIARLFLGDISGVSNYTSSELLFIKVLVFALLLAIINITLKQMPFKLAENKKLGVLISVVVSLLAVRFLTEDALVSFIWLPYGMLGILLTSALPLLILFFFLQGFSSSMIRKFGWIVFSVIFLALALVRWDDLQLTSSNFNLAWIYLAAGGIGTGLFFYDQSIHAKFIDSQWKHVTDQRKLILIGEIQEELGKIDQQLASGNIPESQKGALLRLRKDRVNAMKHLIRK